MNPRSALVAEIRTAQPADGDPVRRIVFEALRSFGIEPDPLGLEAEVMTFGEPKPGVIEMVAVCDGRVAGSVIVTPGAAGHDHLSKFFVDAACRGRGIGRALLARAVETARAAGLRRLELDTRTFMHEAIHLYESTGWERQPGAPPTGPCDRYYALAL